MGNNIHTLPDLSSCDCSVAVTTDETEQLAIKEAFGFVQTRSTITEEVYRFQLKNESGIAWPVRLKSHKLSHSLVTLYEQHNVRVESHSVRDREDRVSWLLHKRVITLASFSDQHSSVNERLMTEASEGLTSVIAAHAITTDCDCYEKTANSWFLHSQIAGILTSVVCSIVIVANLFVLVSVVFILLRNAKKQCQSRLNSSYVFVFNLAMADFFVGVASIVNFALNEARDGASLHTACLLQICFTITPCTNSIFTMTIIGLDRYFSIMHPLKYGLFINVKKAVIMVVVTWIASILLGFAPLMGWGVVNQDYIQEGSICSYLFVVDSSYVIFSLFGIFLPQLVLIIYLYVKIFRVSRRHRRKISQIHMSNVRLSRPRDSDSSNTQDYARPMFTQSCPVTPVMPRVQVSELRPHELAQKLRETSRQGPRRTVSFSPATFDDDGDSSDSSSPPHSPLSFKGEEDDPIIDNVFDNALTLPGSVCALKPIPRITTTCELSSSSMLSSSSKHNGRNNNTKHKLRRTVSYGGSMVISSFTSQLSNRLKSYGSLRKIGIKKDVKALRTVALVVGFFFFMWSPFLIVSVIQMICGSGCQLQNLAGTYLLLLGIANSAINPLVYTYTNRELKKYISRFCCKKTRSAVVTDHEPSGSESLHQIRANNSGDLLTVPAPAWYRTLKRSTSSSSAEENPNVRLRSPRISVVSVSAEISSSPPAALNRRRSFLFGSLTKANTRHNMTSDHCKIDPRFLLPPSGRKASVCNRAFVAGRNTDSCANLLENFRDI